MDNEKRQFDKLCASVRSILGRGAKRDWDLGAALLELQETELWKMARRSDDTPYRGFRIFCRGEFNLDFSEVSRCIRIAESFKREDLNNWSSYNANILANVKRAALRKKLLKEFPFGANTRATTEILNKKIRELADGEFLHPLKQGAVAGSNRVLSAVTPIMLSEPGLQLRIEMTKDGKFKASLVNPKRGVEAVGVDATASTATRNMLADFHNKEPS